jgi:hypothetical protein
MKMNSSDYMYIVYLYHILGAFAKLRTATISFVISGRPSIRIEQLGSHYKDIHKSLYSSIFRKSVQKI